MRKTNNAPAFEHVPLHVLNAAARRADAVQREQAMDAAQVAKDAIDEAFIEQPRNGKRRQKPLRPLTVE
jgi:hypothetical protein